MQRSSRITGAVPAASTFSLRQLWLLLSLAAVMSISMGDAWAQTCWVYTDLCLIKTKRRPVFAAKRRLWLIKTKRRRIVDAGSLFLDSSTFHGMMLDSYRRPTSERERSAAESSR